MNVGAHETCLDELLDMFTVQAFTGIPRYDRQTDFCYTEMDLLGSGAFGTVYKIQQRLGMDSEQVFAMKRVPRDPKYKVP